MDDAELLAEFVDEAREHLGDVEIQLLQIEAMGEAIDDDLVNTVFRAIHSVKGAAGFLGLTQINEVAHRLENVLGRVRDRQLIPVPYNVDVMLKAADRLKSLIESIETSNESDNVELCERLDAVLQRPADGSPADSAGASDAAGADEASTKSTSPRKRTSSRKATSSRKSPSSPGTTSARKQPATKSAAENPSGEKASGKTSAGKDTPGKRSPRQGAANPTTTRRSAGESKPRAPRGGNRVTSTVQPSDAVAARIEAALDATEATLAAAETPPAPPSASASAGAKPPPARGGSAPKSSSRPAVAGESTIRVGVRVLDRLMNLAGELVLCRNQLLQTLAADASSRSTQSNLDSIAAGLDQVTTELQETIMQTRMQPIGNVFNKFPRMIRDLAATLGKQIDLQTEGNEVEMDKTIIEAIADPLTHLIRNSCDHGIERPETRTAAGKPAQGTVVLKAYHQAGKVMIEIIDDGAGIDPEALKAKAITKGLLEPAMAERMSDREAVDLIFAPGFSTAAQITDVSGRGVGMDVVRTNIEQIGGSVEVLSEFGRGSTVQITLRSPWRSCLR